MFWVLFSFVGGGVAAVVLNLPDIPQTPDIPRHIPGYTKNPMSFDMGFSVQKNKPAMTYSPTPTKVQYHRREES